MPILARVLRDRGVVSESQLQQAIQHQVLFGGRLGTSLYELGMITEERLQDALARSLGLSASVVDPRDVEEAAVRAVSRAMAEKHKVCPFRLKGKTLQLLMMDPRDHDALAQIGFALGYIVKPLVVPEFRMIQLLQQHYGTDDRWRYRDTHEKRKSPPLPLSVEAAAQRLDEATTRDEVVSVLISGCLSFFRRVLFFIVREPWLLGWSGAGEGVEPRLYERLRIPLDKPSVFQTVVRDRTLFLGRFPGDEESQGLLRALDKKPATTAAVFPVSLQGRAVNLVYGDNGPGANVRSRLGELLVLAQKVPRAYARIIRARVQESGRTSARAHKEEIGKA